MISAYANLVLATTSAFLTLLMAARRLWLYNRVVSDEKKAKAARIFG